MDVLITLLANRLYLMRASALQMSLLRLVCQPEDEKGGRSLRVGEKARGRDAPDSQVPRVQVELIS